MNCRTAWRGLIAVGTVVLAVTTTAAPTANAVVEDWDRPLMTSQGIDFGKGSYFFGAPVGTGLLLWDRSNGRVNPLLSGTIHLDNVSQEWGRIHMGYFDPGGNLLVTYHSTSHKAIDNAHHEFAVDFPRRPPRADLAAVEICTELSGNNVTFNRIRCKRYEFNN
jgi:hypothetical protein